jgi:uncharacterized membrane protein (DUF373 family)
MADVAEKAADEKEHSRGVAGTIWVLERTQDLVSVVVGVLLAVLAVVVLVLGVVVFFRNVTTGPVETAVIILLNQVLLVLILVEIMHTVVLSLRAHHLVIRPLLAVGLVAVIRKILFVLSSEEPVSTAELALLIAMIGVFVAALILVARFDRTDGLRRTARRPGLAFRAGRLTLAGRVRAGGRAARLHNGHRGQVRNGRPVVRGLLGCLFRRGHPLTGASLPSRSAPARR